MSRRETLLLFIFIGLLGVSATYFHALVRAEHLSAGEGGLAADNPVAQSLRLLGSERSSMELVESLRRLLTATATFEAAQYSIDEINLELRQIVTDRHLELISLEYNAVERLDGDAVLPAWALQVRGNGWDLSNLYSDILQLSFLSISDAQYRMDESRGGTLFLRFAGMNLVGGSLDQVIAGLEISNQSRQIVSRLRGSAPFVDISEASVVQMLSAESLDAIRFVHRYSSIQYEEAEVQDEVAPTEASPVQDRPVAERSVEFIGSVSVDGSNPTYMFRNKENNRRIRVDGSQEAGEYHWLLLEVQGQLLKVQDNEGNIRWLEIH